MDREEAIKLAENVLSTWNTQDVEKVVSGGKLCRNEVYFDRTPLFSNK